MKLSKKTGEPDTDDSVDHRDETYKIDNSRFLKLQEMIHTALSKDNCKKIAQIIAKEDRRLSTLARDRLKTLWNFMLDFQKRFNGGPIESQGQLDYMEALIEILRLQGSQTSAWKIVLHEATCPFSGKLSIEILALYGMQKREAALFTHRADKLAGILRAKFEAANPPNHLSEEEEDEDSDQDPPNPESSQDRRDDKNDPDFKGPEHEKDANFSESDEEFLTWAQPNCNTLQKPKSPTKKEPAGDELALAPTATIGSPPSLTKLSPITSSPKQVTLHRDENPKNNIGSNKIMTTKEILNYEVQFPKNQTNGQNTGISATPEKPKPRFPFRKVDMGHLASNRLARDEIGCDQYLQNHISETREHETATADSWGRQGLVQEQAQMQAGRKRAPGVRLPAPKRSRSSLSEKMRQMNIQLQNCLSEVRRLSFENRTAHNTPNRHIIQEPNSDEFRGTPGRKRKCSSCTKALKRPIYHPGPFGGRGPFCQSVRTAAFIDGTFSTTYIE